MNFKEPCRRFEIPKFYIMFVYKSDKPDFSVLL